jgi:hypothetical protein
MTTALSTEVMEVYEIIAQLHLLARGRQGLETPGWYGKHPEAR